MKIVRIDDLGGTPRQFHPQLTVISDVDDQQREQFIDLFDKIASGHGVEATVTLEISGILLHANDETMEQLQLTNGLNGAVTMRPPFEQLRAVAPPPIPSSVFEAANSAPTNSEASATREVEEGGVRAELRKVSTALQELQQQVNSHRDHVRPHSQAAVDVAAGQLEALDQQYVEVKSQWEKQQHDFDLHQSELTRRYRELDTHIQTIEFWGEALEGGFGKKILAIDASEPVRRITDGEALELANTLEALLGELRQSSRTYVEHSDAAIELRQDIRSLEIELAAVTTNEPQVDNISPKRSQVEEIRSELFELVEHSVKSRTPWSRKRIEELRDQEAALLKELGFETYSDLIIGSATHPRLDAVDEQREELQQRLRQKRNELEEVVHATGSADELTRLLHQITAVLRMSEDVFERAGQKNVVIGELQRQLQDHLSSPRIVAMTFDEALPNAVVGITQVVDALRDLKVPDTDAETQLLETLEEFDRHFHELQSEAQRKFGVQPQEVGQELSDNSGDNRERLINAQSWLRSLSQQRKQLSHLYTERDSLKHELESLTQTRRNSKLLQRWSELEQQRDELLQRLLEAEEQLQHHQDAMAAIAQLRNKELELREQERSLIERLGTESEVQLTSPTSHGVASATQSSELPATPLSAQTASFVAVGRDVDPSERKQVITEWDIVRELSFRRDVSFVGSVPVLVLDAELGPNSTHLPSRQKLFDRFVAMSKHIQIVMLTNDEAVKNWAYGLGTAASVL